MAYVIYWKVVGPFSWNLSRLFTVCVKCHQWLLRGHHQSLKSKLLYWSLPFAQLWSKISSPNLAVRQKWFCYEICLDKIQDGSLREVCILGAFSSFCICFHYGCTGSRILLSGRIQIHARSWHVGSGRIRIWTGSSSLGYGRIWIQTSTTADNRRKITLSAPLLEETGMTVYVVLWPNFYLSDN